MLNASLRLRPPAGEIHLRQLAVVDQVVELTREAEARALTGLHLWSESTVSQRFHYRRPGLFLLLVRIFLREAPHIVTELPEMAGCKSWVELPEPLSTTSLTPALSDASFAEQKAAVLAALRGTQT
jgi:hypothetical protein